MIQRFRSFLPIGSIFMKRPQVFPTGPKCPPVWCTCLWFFKIKKEQRWPKEGSWHEKQGQKQSQSPESVTPNVRVRNPITKSQSSPGSREEDQGLRRKTESQQQRVGHPLQENPGTLGKTESQQQRVSHHWKPEGGSRKPWENGPPIAKSTNSPSRNPKATLKNPQTNTK